MVVLGHLHPETPLKRVKLPELETSTPVQASSHMLEVKASERSVSLGSLVLQTHEGNDKAATARSFCVEMNQVSA